MLITVLIYGCVFLPAEPGIAIANATKQTGEEMNIDGTKEMEIQRGVRGLCRGERAM